MLMSPPLVPGTLYTLYALYASRDRGAGSSHVSGSPLVARITPAETPKLGRRLGISSAIPIHCELPNPLVKRFCGIERADRAGRGRRPPERLDRVGPAFQLDVQVAELSVDLVRARPQPDGLAHVEQREVLLAAALQRPSQLAVRRVARP